MTIKEYLKEHLSKTGNIPSSSIEIWEMAVQGRGKVTVEYSPETDSADIIHDKHNRGSDFYDARTGKELKDIVEFCLGPVVSESQWNQAKETEVFAGEYEEDEEFN
jgi:hypothetical protein